MLIKLPVTWEECGTVEIEADSIEEALEKFQYEEPYLELPNNNVYIDGSFQLSSNDPESIRYYQTAETLKKLDKKEQ